MPRCTAPTARGVLLWGRSSLLATVAVCGGTAAHLAGGGHSSGPTVSLSLLLATTVGVAPLLRRELGRVTTVALLVSGQAGVHAVLTALSGHGDEGGATHDPARWLDHLTGDLRWTTGAMSLGHALAAGVVALWLAAGERALWALLRGLGSLLPRPLRPASTTGGPRPVPVGATRAPHRAVRVGDVTPRGPPRDERAAQPGARC
ncbi:MAG: hypothetical protein WB441_17120 [Nocardioidaceae bacterium]